MGGYGGSWQKEFYLECILTGGYTDSMYRWEAVQTHEGNETPTLSNYLMQFGRHSIRSAKPPV